MKRLITVIGILLTLLAGPSWAVEPINLALAPAILGGAGAGVAAGGGTWYYVVDTYTETLTNNPNTFTLGAAVTIGASGDITAIAFKVKAKNSATVAKIALYEHTLSSSISALANGTCTPADESWCIASVTYSGTPSTAYYVGYRADDGGLTQYGDTSGTDGFYENTSTNYETFPGMPVSLQTYSSSWAVAICAGGACSSGP